MKSHGIQHLSYVQIDNPLAKAFDPIFIGAHLDTENSSAQFSSKFVSKRSSGERAGVFAVADGKLKVIEYSNLPESMAIKKNS